MRRPPACPNWCCLLGQRRYTMLATTSARSPTASTVSRMRWQRRWRRISDRLHPVVKTGEPYCGMWEHDFEDDDMRAIDAWFAKAPKRFQPPSLVTYRVDEDVICECDKCKHNKCDCDKCDTCKEALAANHYGTLTFHWMCGNDHCHCEGGRDEFLHCNGDIEPAVL